MAPDLPGVERPIDAVRGDVQVDLRIPDGLTAGDVRRLVNAGLHRIHLQRDRLCVHGVAVRQPSGEAATVLLGGHGSGKTLVSMALAQRGWEVLTADVTIIQTSAGQTARVLGGTRATRGRPDPIRRWFPNLPVPDGRGDSVDLSGVLSVRFPADDLPAVGGVVLVDVDGDPQTELGSTRELDMHTAATVWLRASSHLLDRVLDCGVMLRPRFETGDEATRRMGGIRALSAGRMHWSTGSPQRIADQIQRMGQR